MTPVMGSRVIAANSGRVLARNLSVGVRSGGPLNTSRKHLHQWTPGTGAQIAGTTRSATSSGFPAQSVRSKTVSPQGRKTVPPQGETQKDNLNVEIVEKKGDVVVWGPTHSRDREGARLPRIICYGDSNTAGYHSGGREFQPYAQSLAAELADAGMPCEVAVCGLCSFTTQDMLNEQSSDSVITQIGPHGRGLARMLDEDGPVALVIIMTGTNDLGSCTPQTTIMQRIALLHGVCHQRSVPTVALAATYGSFWNHRIERQQLASSLAKWATSATDTIDCLDVEDLLPRPGGKDGASNLPASAVHWEADDLHLSATGSIALGRRMAPHVSSWLKLLETDGADAKASALTKKGCSAPVPAGSRTPLECLPRPAKEILADSGKAKPVYATPSIGGCGFALANVPRRQISYSRSTVKVGF